MALFLDGPACTIDDLLDEDSGLLDTAQTVGINVTAKLKLAMSEVQSELVTMLARVQATDIGQVVATTDLARWEKMQALSMVYRDAAYTQLIDRYKAKWDMFIRLTAAARDQFTANGVGVVNDPVMKATLPVLGTISGESQSGGTFYACVAWVNAGGQEGAPSEAGSIAVPTDNLMTVMAANVPSNATGFNVYAGSVLGMMTLQNLSPVAPGGSFTYVPGESPSSKTPGAGQAPDVFKAIPATTLRG
jgi:hypothetical protein